MRKRFQVFAPEDLLQPQNVGPLHGRYFSESGVFNIVPTSLARQSPYLYPMLGHLYTSEEEVPQDTEMLQGVQNGDGLSFHYQGNAYQTKLYSLHHDLFSRNTGILESDILLNKHVFLLGAGSVGSLVALELARSGVGRFTLVDNDVLKYHNLARHQCSVQDVGDYKVYALARRIREINPYAKVTVYVNTIEMLQKEDFATLHADDSIVIGSADNRPADVYANAMAVMAKTPFVSIGCWQRAFAGAVFYWLPGMPCYHCALGDGGGFDQRTDVSRRFYVDEEEAAQLNFEPGIAADIDFVTLVGVKLALDLLLRDSAAYTPRLLGCLKQYTLVCNTNKPEIGGELAEIFSYPLQVTTSLKTNFCAGCPPCKYE